MGHISVNTRALKSRLGYYLRLVKTGESLEITERGMPIARIIPAASLIEDRIEAMASVGLLMWSKSKLKPMTPVARIQGNKTVSSLLVKDRE